MGSFCDDRIVRGVPSGECWKVRIEDAEFGLVETMATSKNARTGMKLAAQKCR